MCGSTQGDLHLFALRLHHPLVLRPLPRALLLPGGALLADPPQPLGQQVAAEGLELGRVQDVQHVRRKVLADLKAFTTVDFMLRDKMNCVAGF